MVEQVITPVQRDDTSALGWAVAILIILGLVLFGLFVWPGVGANSAVTPRATTPTNQGIDVNVRLPEGVVPSTQLQNTVPQNQGGTVNP